MLNCTVTYTVCVKLYCYIYTETGGKLYNKHRYDNVSKLVETDHEGKVTVLIVIYLLTEIGLTPGGNSGHPVAVLWN